MKTEKSKPQLLSSSRLKKNPEEMVRVIYRTLAPAWGPQHWWPAATPFEVIAGAILTQNTSWTNVNRALTNLRDAALLSVEGIRELPLAQLETLIRSSGYFRQKAQRLKGFVAFLDAKYEGSLERMFSIPTEELRPELLALKGIGQETADAILLYGGGHEVFVIDAYARRVFSRHGICAPGAKYDELRTLVEHALREEAIAEARTASAGPVAHEPSPMSLRRRSRLAQIYNEMHGLIVQVAKHYCHKERPKCEECPLGAMLSRAERKRLTGNPPPAGQSSTNPQ